MKHHLLLKTWLLALILFSAQLVAVSPLHDHEDGGRAHVVDCSICKLHTGDHLLPGSSIVLTASRTPVLIDADEPALLLRHAGSPYQGRAPPAFSL